jgi:hypothetical protein
VPPNSNEVIAADSFIEASQLKKMESVTAIDSVTLSKNVATADSTEVIAAVSVKETGKLPVADSVVLVTEVSVTDSLYDVVAALVSAIAAVSVTDLAKVAATL